MLNVPYTKAQLFLLAMVAGLDAQTQADIANRDVQFSDADMYLRSNITGGAGIKELLDATNTKQIGTSNWDKNALPASVNIALERIRVAYATTASADGITNPANLKYSTKLSDVPAALLNAELVITQNDKPIVEVPMQRFFSEAVNNRPVGTEDALILDSLRLIKENVPVGINIKFPNGLALAGANHFVEIHLMGTQTRKR
jgi:hypothetical protein